MLTAGAPLAVPGMKYKKARAANYVFIYLPHEELSELFTSAGFVEELNHVDRRLQVNRGKQLEMYRVWIQCKFRKPK
ncbi:methyltransferase protein 2-A-like [Tropilaelaps mercedesae]|uniref:Methyltransferase protein 2-A-like n=1 Tax=Tropilaelaps mercedesae TaxID=418985 RepID=A0A1V9XPR7_9ACAR|nr:methyltransferase protein 2-A-like [Tropilaelaps mercedesae]